MENFIGSIMTEMVKQVEGLINQALTVYLKRPPSEVDKGLIEMKYFEGGKSSMLFYNGDCVGKFTYVIEGNKFFSSFEPSQTQVETVIPPEQKPFPDTVVRMVEWFDKDGAMTSNKHGDLRYYEILGGPQHAEATKKEWGGKTCFAVIKENKIINVQANSEL